MPSRISARVIAGPREFPLTTAPQIVPAGSLIIGVSRSPSRTVLLDGRAARLSSGVEGFLGIDLTRSTGFHRLEVAGESYWFGTEDAKLRLAGIESMLADLRRRGAGTGWTGQALFSDGAGLRDAHVVYGWLDSWADRALDAVDAILASPRSVSTSGRALSRRGGRAVLVAPTLRLLRSDPRRYLEPNPAGMLSVGDGSYDPLRVVVRKRTTSLDTLANRRAVSLVSWIDRMSEEVLASDPDSTVRVRCRLWRNRAQTLGQRPLARSLRSRAGQGTAGTRQVEETIDASYRTSFDTSQDLGQTFGWSATIFPLNRLSYVERSDRIYQAYVASRFAEMLGLHQTSNVLGSTSPAFSGPGYELYYDCFPPAHILRSWRATSTKPDQSRPDLLLHETATGKVSLIDAKYRVDPGGSASESSRKEVTAYLGLYGLRSISIVYPGDEPAVVREVAGEGMRIVEVPLTPSTADLDSALPVILATLQSPPFSDERD